MSAMMTKDVSSKADTKKTPSDHKHPGDPHLRNYNSAMKVNKGSEPSGTITSGGANPEMSMPILPTGKVMASSDAYARLLDAELPREAPPTCGLSLAEFFCCAGGIGLGFRSAGFHLAFANDISKHAAASYAYNLGHEPIVRDIREIGLNDYGDHVSKVDVVTLSIEFDTVESRDETKSTIKRLATESNSKPGDIVTKAIAMLSSLRPV